ncbi:hypothetical protein HU200_012985 [Digitaria exilis]|uniref:CASP-like protein n=1 Tax=Digitaria exilis TaxID=1010633 RepID=A0A835FEM8_9POAL|nr:hypothetical protein HU200_012985 [Digitaria exilis]CAB3497698.1 unnamed protein product [Digitaria exilis]
MSKPVPADAPPSVVAPAPEVAAVDGGVSEREPAGGGGVRSMVERWKMEGAPARARLVLRALGWLFSLLALVVMASNQHGHGGSQDFRQYPEYNYCLGIAIVAWLYTTAQVVRDVHRLGSGRDLIGTRKTSALVDFTGDQVVAYFLISAMSAAVPVTDYMRQKADNLFTDSAAAAISMAFFAFVAIGLSALVSGYSFSMEVLV